ncbi:hypothetical protein THMIRHAM_03100 [Thiomicrorhabdus immobilis]|uniref:TolC family protein n=1 Tax=Thiomicrorhabdus immobilis TaxID=2791037 RepID=A0ABM7MB12_9GAMM|nr:TolC family protein [Thiomicrorhabdus immobilis]BCN92525.1 hypothetical protein THMIRHAM_03100 [Thiomicrorhabdus immobilis]
MKNIHAYRLIGLLSAGLVFSFPAQAKTYAELLQNVQQQQPEQAALQSYGELETTVSQSADSWFAGNANLVVAHENDALTGDLQKQKWHIGAEMPLWLPGQAQSQQNLARGLADLNSYQAWYLKWQASGQLRDLVWQYQESQVKADIAEQSVAQAQQLNDLIATLVKVGEKPKIDALLADKALLNAQAQRLNLQSMLESNRQQYQYWTNTQELPSPLTETIAKVDLQKHPELNRLKAQLAVLGAEYQTAKATEKDNPTFSFGGFQEEDKATSANNSLYAQITYPLGSSPLKKVETAKQRTAFLEKQAEVKRYQMVLENQLKKAKQQISLAQQKLSLMQQELQIATQTLQLATQAYKAGESNIQTLVNAQQDFLNSKLQQSLTEIELNKAIAQHNQIAGDSL